ncbi:UNVERIFIED_CONTAM: Solute carrier family 40 member 2 [Sesamum radiatum]|uniref:Solute carrier family 40 member n=1 Tax=Sesamum radiatum TaxID=300843 RepID=A0AAW2KSZ9_SESRA
MNEPLLDVEEQQPPSFSSSLLVNLYVGHFLARWGARMWEFSVGLYMINVWPDSLLLAAAYGVVESASTALFGPLIGQLVDKLSYIQVLQLWLLNQNLSFMVAGVLASNVRLQWDPVIKRSQAKEGIKIFSEEKDESMSTHHEKKSLVSSDTNDSKQPESSSERTIIEKFLNLPYITAWRLYIEQDVVLPGLALALLYFTVLSFGTLMTAALEWQGIPAYVIGIARGIAATVGIAATFLYPVLQSHISTLRTGLWSIWSQWTCLLLCVGSIFVKDKLTSAYMLMFGVASSRLGLWMFDLSVIQQMQDHVPESDRCVVGGVQNSLQSVLDLMTYIMGIVISNPQDFWKLTMLSFVLVTLAAVLYSLHIYRVRKHLFHFDKLLALIRWSVTSS